MSRRQARRTRKTRYREFKGKAPFLSDQIFEWIIKMIIQLIIFTAFYYSEIDAIKTVYQGDKIGGFLAELFMVVKYLIISDAIAHLFGWIAKRIFLHMRKYISSSGKNNNYGRWLWEYLLYLGLRTLFFMIQFISLLNVFLNPYLSVLSFFVAWLTVSLLSIILANFLARYIITK